MQPQTKQPGEKVIAIGPVVGGSVAAPDPLNVVAIAYAPVADPFHSWVTETDIELFERLRELVGPAPGGEKLLIAVLVLAPPADAHDPDAVAAVESVRGAILSLAVELGPRVHLNVVISDEPDSARATLEYLASPEADYVTGSTFDLREFT